MTTTDRNLREALQAALVFIDEPAGADIDTLTDHDLSVEFFAKIDQQKRDLVSQIKQTLAIPTEPEMPLSMNQFGRLVDLTREHLTDKTFVYKATSKTGDTCHFGVESAAKAWAKGGTVEATKVREFKLHTGVPAADHFPDAGNMIEPSQQHHRDSKELRSLCQARDEARKQRDLCQAEIAGLNSAVGHLSAMVDEQTRLVQKAVQAMKALHETAKPDDGPDMNAIIPAAAFHVFVDVQAELMFALKQGPQITTQSKPRDPSENRSKQEQ